MMHAIRAGVGEGVRSWFDARKTIFAWVGAVHKRPRITFSFVATLLAACGSRCCSGFVSLLLLLMAAGIISLILVI
ncbi:transmembrane protein, putative [Medicago truncatula]|uniref:Transmembrane protein, putative n=1 Tax=Medicago truncatula TaxID=3880 RepID=G7JWZ9_MEDTR|nr:transmembrane protein, putative [Medicago truncatula]